MHQGRDGILYATVLRSPCRHLDALWEAWVALLSLVVLVLVCWCLIVPSSAIRGLVGTIGSDVSESDIHVSLADDCGVVVLVVVKFCITVGNVHGMMKAGFEGVRESRQ